jgi:hypothetical protein
VIKVYHCDHDEVKKYPFFRGSHLMMGFDHPEGMTHVQVVTALWTLRSSATGLPAQVYKLVAEVDSDDLEFAWRWTNNVDSSWSMEPQSHVAVKAPLHVLDGKTCGLRSSSVGDVFEKNGALFAVCNIGFTPLDADRLAQAASFQRET